MELFSVALLSLRVTLLAMLFVVPVGLWGAWYLARRGRFIGRAFLEVALSLPLILPPTVIGYGLLLLFGRETAVGRFLQDTLHIRLLFTWQGAACASALLALPLFVRTASVAFAAIDTDLIAVARTLGASEARIFVSVALPLASRGLFAAGTLAFARALGEFGATLMVAGSIPGETETLPLRLYAAVQAGDSHTATVTALLLTVFSGAALSLAFYLSERAARPLQTL